MEQENLASKRTSGSAGGKRLAKRKRRRTSSGSKAAVILAAAVLLFAGYAALCTWAGAKLPAGVTVELQPGGQEIALGGLTAGQAKELLAQSIQLDSTRTLSIVCGGHGAALDAACFTADPDGMLQTLGQAEDLMIGRPFLLRGLDLLSGRGAAAGSARIQMDCSYCFTEEGEKQADALLDAFAQIVAAEPAETTYTVEEESIEVICGVPGAVLDKDAAKQTILVALPRPNPSSSVRTAP